VPYVTFAISRFCIFAPLFPVLGGVLLRDGLRLPSFLDLPLRAAWMPLRVSTEMSPMNSHYYARLILILKMALAHV
jgi:hypothetical protein